MLLRESARSPTGTLFASTREPCSPRLVRAMQSAQLAEDSATVDQPIEAEMQLGLLPPDLLVAVFALVPQLAR